MDGREGEAERGTVAGQVSSRLKQNVFGRILDPEGFVALKKTRKQTNNT